DWIEDKGYPRSAYIRAEVETFDLPRRGRKLGSAVKKLLLSPIHGVANPCLYALLLSAKRGLACLPLMNSSPQPSLTIRRGGSRWPSSSTARSWPSTPSSPTL